MGISFSKRKLKIKIIQHKDTVTEEEQKEKIPAVTVPKNTEKKIDKSSLKVNRTFKEILNEITSQSTKKLHLSDFTAYMYYFSDGRYQFHKVTGNNTALNEITLEKYLSVSETTVIKRATGLSESEEYRSRLVIHYSFEDKNYIFLWSSILYEAFDNEMITGIKNLLCEMRN